MNVLKDLQHRRGPAVRLLLNSFFVGLAAGIAVTLYRLLIPFLGDRVKSFILAHRGSAAGWILVLLLLTAAGLAAALIVRREPSVSGSGTPEITGFMQGRLQLPRLRGVLYKFIGGLMALAAGLTLGRGGPSVQLGASAARLYGKLFKRSLSETRFLVASGAAAGLSATFNAPMTGLMFSLEQVHRSLSPLAMISAMSAALSANIVSGAVFGVDPILSIPTLPHMQLRIYWLLLILGILLGLSGVLFNFLIIRGKALYARLPVPAFWVPVIPFILTGLAVLADPELFGSGEHLFFLPLGENLAPVQLFLLYAAKLLLFLLAFCSGLPGGIFFPLLILGSLCGNLFGSLCARAGLIESQWIVVFAVIAMSAHFASITRAPITGILLMIEITGSFHYLLPLGLVTLTAYLTAELCRSKPINDALMELLLQKQQASLSADIPAERAGTADILVEYPVCLNSRADGSLIRDLPFPDEFLLVSVRRGSREILPKGSVRLQAGDYLSAMLNHNDLGEIEDEMNLLTRADEQTEDELRG